MYIEKTDKPWFKPACQMYGVKCDVCGIQFENDDDYAWFYSREELEEAIRESDWLNPAPGVHYCPYEDGNDMEQIPF